MAMPTYITAVQLVAASEADVEKLYEAMKTKSFHRTDHRSAKDQAAKGPIEYASTTKASLVDVSTGVTTVTSSSGGIFLLPLGRING
jgi:hypothetical protein